QESLDGGRGLLGRGGARLLACRCGCGDNEGQQDGEGNRAHGPLRSSWNRAGGNQSCEVSNSFSNVSSLSFLCAKWKPEDPLHLGKYRVNHVDAELSVT